MYTDVGDRGIDVVTSASHQEARGDGRGTLGTGHAVHEAALAFRERHVYEAQRVGLPQRLEER